MNAGVSKGGFLILAALLGASAWALTRAELVKAEDAVREMTAPLVKALARGEMTPLDAAEETRIAASQTVSPAEEYLLLQGSIRLFVRARAYPRVVELARHLQTRGYSAARLATLIEGALEPVPRGVNVGELETYLRALQDEAARARKHAAEKGLEAALAALPPLEGKGAPPGTFLGLLARVRAAAAEKGARFNVVVRCPLAADGADGFPVLPPANTPGNLALFLADCTAAGRFTMRAHGRLRLFTRTEPFTASRPIEAAFFAGNTAETIRRMKRIPIGFVAFDENEPLDEALERLFLTVADYAAETAAFDLLLRSAPNGRYPLLHTLRASDTTLYDVLHLACRSAGIAFDVRGTCIIVGARHGGEGRFLHDDLHGRGDHPDAAGWRDRDQSGRHARYQPRPWQYGIHPSCGSLPREDPPHRGRRRRPQGTLQFLSVGQLGLDDRQARFDGRCLHRRHVATRADAFGFAHPRGDGRRGLHADAENEHP